MLDIGWSELVLIGVVALIVVGPKDLPQMFRQLGRFTAKARSMAREFSTAMESAAKEAGLDEATNDLRNMTSKKALGLDALESAATRFEQWKPNLTGAATAAGTAAAAATTPGAAVEAAGDSSATAPRGPATQALADKLAAKAAERANPTTALIPDPDAAAPAAAMAHPEAAPAKTPMPRAARAAAKVPAKAVANAGAEAAKAPAARSRKTATAKGSAAKAEAAPEPATETPRRKKTTT